MNNPPSLPIVTVVQKTVDADTVFTALADSARRRILAALCDGRPQYAQPLTQAAGKRPSNTLKHLDALLKAGLIVARPDPADTRRRLYTLAPFVKVTASPEGRTMDFGYCVLRV